MNRDELIQAAVGALGGFIAGCECTLESDTCYLCESKADAVIDAVLPLIRDQLADELLHTELPKDIWDTTRVKGWFVEGARWAAAIVRGEQP